MIISAAALVFMTWGCGSTDYHKKTAYATKEPETTVRSDASTEIVLPYNLTMKAVVVKMDTAAGVIQLQNTSGGADYILTYSSGTVIKDKYGNARLPDMVKEGDIVEAYINDEQSTLSGLCYSSENWEFEGSANWKFNSEKSELNIGKEKYYYSDDMLLLSEGKEINLMDLNESDILNIQGCGKKVLSVTVERGHGYVKLEGVTDFVGGWVEIGKVIKPVSEDMLIVVPEGNWDVTVVKDGYGGSIAATVARNEESTVDFTGVAQEIVRYGTVEFTIEPEDAILYIAGREVDYSKQILLEYDTYKIRVSADGYEDYTGDLKVGKALVGKKITLNKEGTSQEPEGSEAVQSSENPKESSSVTVITSEKPASAKDTSTNDEAEVLLGYQIHINSPENVSVYFDDVYIGVSPVSLTKMSGNHTITFSKEGYATKSYSVEIGTEEKDVTFELPDLEHEK